MVATAAYNIGALIATMGLDTTQFQAGMASVNASTAAADAATKKAAMSMSASMAAAGDKMAAVGKKMTRYMTLPILAVGIAATKTYSDFEASMAKIVGLVGVSRTQVEAWKKEVLALGPATGQGPDKLADALFFITSAGIRGAEAMEVLEMAAKAATSGLGEAKVVADLVTSAMNAYGKENLNAAMATDILVATVREGKAEATSLAAAMGMVLPIASEYGVTFDQVGAAFAGMTRTGTNARVAATQLKAILSSMASPSEKAERALKKYGTSSAEFRSIVEEEGLIAALLHLREATEGNKVAMAEIFPNIRGLMGVLDLLGKNVEGNKAIFDALKDSSGALDFAFASASDTMKFRFNKAFATLKTRLIALGQTLSGSLIPMLENVTALIERSTDKWNNMSEHQKQNRIRVLALTAAMGPLLKITGRLFKLMATPKGPYMIAIAGAVALTLAVRNLILKKREEKEVYDVVADANAQVIRQYEAEATKITYLTAIIEDENISREGRLAAIKELKTIFPGYKGDLSKEGTLIKHNKDELVKYLVQLKEKIRLQVFEGEYVTAVQKEVQAQRDLDTALTASRMAQEKLTEAGGKMYRDIAVQGSQFVSQIGETTEVLTEEGMAVRDTNVELAERRAELKQAVEDQKALTEEMKKYNIVLGGGDPGIGGGDGDGDGKIVEDDALELAEKQAQARLDLARFIADEELALITNKFQKQAATEILEYERAKSALEKQGADKLLTAEEVAAGIEALEAAHQQRMVDIAADGAEEAANAAAKARTKEQKAQAAYYNQLVAWYENDKKKYFEAIQAKREAIQQSLQIASNAVSALSDFTLRAMDKEIEAAGDNKEKRLAIEQDYFKKQKKWAIAQAIINGALAVTNMMANVPLSALNPLTWVGIGIAAASTIAQVAVIASQNFAAGAVVSGPTMANIGEYPGARHNPEIVAPLDKLQAIIGDTGPGWPSQIEFKIKRRDLIALIKMDNTLSNTY
jgi:TP901 family phage tail tape measure protein